MALEKKTIVCLLINITMKRKKKSFQLNVLLSARALN